MFFSKGKKKSKHSSSNEAKSTTESQSILPPSASNGIHQEPESMFVITSTENKLKESKDTDHHQSSTPFPSPTDDAIHQPPSSSTSTSHPEPFIIFSTPHAPPASEMLHLRLSHSSSNSHQSQSQPEYQDFHVSRTLLFQIPWFAKERSKIERHFHLHAHSHPHPLAGNPHPYPGYPHRSFSGLSIHSKASSHNPSHSNAHSSSSHDESQVQAQAEQQDPDQDQAQNHHDDQNQKQDQKQEQEKSNDIPPFVIPQVHGQILRPEVFEAILLYTRYSVLPIWKDSRGKLDAPRYTELARLALGLGMYELVHVVNLTGFGRRGSGH
ncbi:hypothetical protein MMC10_008666 [Thelotrema lepadinum]|nr:hypothetical protein [Thelotrema lepadinum]